MSAAQTNAANKDKLNKAVKAQSADAKEGAKQAKKEATAVAKIEVKANALSTDVGPILINSLMGFAKAEAKAEELVHQAGESRNEAITRTVAAIYRLAQNDPSVDLSVYFSTDDKIKTQVNIMNNKIRLALGIYKYNNVKGKEILGYAPDLVKYFPQPGEDVNDPIVKRKSSVRTALTHSLRHCAERAEALLQMKADVSIDKATKSLQISGPKVQAEYGASTVVIGGGKTQGDTELKTAPTFDQLRTIATKAHGKDTTRDESGNLKKVAAKEEVKSVDPETALISNCAMLVQHLSKLQGPATAQLRKSLESAKSAIDVVLDRGA